jgi:hypothetical protein
MFRRGSQVVSLFALVVLFVGLFPLGVAAQFPSQQQEAPPQGQGGFPSQGGGQGGGRGGFFQSPNFGGSLTWGPEWELLDQSTDPTIDVVSVTNGTSTITIGWGNITDAPQDAVVNLADVLGDGTWTFDQAVIDEANSAAAYFTEPQGETAHLVAVDTFADQTGRIIVWNFPSSQYDAEFEAFVSLLDGLA